MQQPSTDKKETTSVEIMALRLLVKRQPSLMIYASKEVLEMLQLTPYGNVRDYQTEEETAALVKMFRKLRHNAVTLEQNVVLVLEQDHTDVKRLDLSKVQDQFDTVCRITVPSFHEIGNGLMITMLKQRMVSEYSERFPLNRVDPVI